jgi:amino acid adenylation domain-containing protein
MDVSVPRDPWARCSSADRTTFEGLQGGFHPVAADEVIGALWQRYIDGGSAVAVIDRDRDWTYGQLGEWVLGLRARLDEVYPRHGSTSRVFAVSIGRGASLVAATHAVALGADAYCPVEPADPPGWRGSVVTRSGASAVLVSGDAGVWPAGTAERFDVRPGLAAQPARRRPAVSETGIAQVIFTSGSTGQPKGVLCTHAGFANRIRWMQRAFPLTGADRVALKTPFTFDVAGWELFWPQYAGAQTVVVSPGQHTSPEALTATFTKYAVTVAHFVPSMLALWLRADGARRCPDLRMVFCSGEALGADLVAEFRRQSSAQLHNLYGPAEAAIDVTHFRADSQPRTPVPIGRAIDNTRVLVLDDDQSICPIGETGEIYLQGIGVAAGYLGTDAPSFAALPSLPVPAGWRTFRTGDLGRYTADGQVEYCGRIDDQVKIRGQRVELGEVEAALREHELVLDAGARPYGEGSGRLALAAYVTINPQHDVADPVGTLAAYLARTLPSRSVPARILVIDEMPLGPRGKVDRARLPQPGNARPVLAHPFEPPAPGLETRIAAVWEQVLSLEGIGRNDDYRELGGNSLSAVETCYLLAERLGLDYDSDLLAEMIMNGNTIASAARIAIDGGIEDS